MATQNENQSNNMRIVRVVILIVIVLAALFYFGGYGRVEKETTIIESPKAIEAPSERNSSSSTEIKTVEKRSGNGSTTEIKSTRTEKSK